MLQNLSQEIRECLRRVEECTRLAKTAVTAGAINDYLEMEQRWLALARSYEFAERLSNFTAVQEPQTAEKAQQTGVRHYLRGGTWELVGEFIEIQSGKHADRPQLATAIEICRRQKAHTRHRQAPLTVS
jgi:hypothetical protein